MDYKKYRKEFLNDKGWIEKECNSCRNIFYYKKKSDNCGSYKCEGGHKFLQIPSPKKFSQFNEIESGIEKVLEKHEFERENPIEVKRDNERTLFASAAGQIYDNLIYGKSYSDDTNKKYCFQPVIRLQGINKISEFEGISSSFLNVGSEIWNATIEDHYNTLDNWFDIFSNLGFLVSNLNLKYKQDFCDWDGKIISSESLKINYAGLEIGIANFFYNIPTLGNNNSTLSDISIGLERLAWALNKTDSYFDAIGPIEFVLNHNREKLDAIRTLALMASSKVLPETNNHGHKFRMIIKRLSNPLSSIPIKELVEYYYDQWNHFSHFDYNLTLTVHPLFRHENQFDSC